MGPIRGDGGARDRKNRGGFGFQDIVGNRDGSGKATHGVFGRLSRVDHGRVMSVTVALGCIDSRDLAAGSDYQVGGIRQHLSPG